MPTANTPARQALQRRLEKRQQLADEAVAALAHGQANADRLYAQLAEYEGALENDHKAVVARNFGTWATHDATQLAEHQADNTAGCARCQAAQTQAPASLSRTA